MELKGKNVLVCGMARSGISAAKLLVSIGASVTVSDSKERGELNEQDCLALEKIGVKLYLGKNPDDISDNLHLIVLSPGIRIDLPFIEKAKAADIPVWSEVELAFRFCGAPIIAITGTNGKTTTTTLTGRIMKEYRPGSIVVGNIGVAICETVSVLNPQAFAVAEVSSFQLEAAVNFKPRISAVLNITPDHIDRHKTFDTYIAMKERIFANQGENDFLVLNFDDEICRKMWEKTKAKVLFFSRKYELPDGIFMKDGEMLMKWEGRYEKIIDRSEINSVFEHTVENAMAAAGIAVCAGVPLEIVRKVFREFRGIEHRVEFCGEKNGVEYYNDSKATNVDAAVKALEGVTKPVLLIGGGKDKDVDFSEWVRLFESKVKLVVLIGETAGKIIECCKAHGYAKYERANTLRDATELCHLRAEAGDCVLLSPACASLDMFSGFEQRGNIFKAFVKELCDDC